MNTGVQRSSATPLKSWTTTTPYGATEDHVKKNIMAIVAAHQAPYIATACVSYPEDLAKKVRKAKRIRGFRFIHLLVPCPTGWRYPARNTIRLGRLAVLSRVFPLYEVTNGRQYQLSPMGAKLPVDEYLTLQGRFRGISPKDISLTQEIIDTEWADLEARADMYGRK